MAGPYAPSLTHGLGVKSPALLPPRSREDAAIDQSTIQDATTLTLIGFGTAFALLMILMVFITVVGRLVRIRSVGEEKDIQLAQDSDGLARDKATAAVVGVGVMLAARRRAGKTGAR